VGAVKNPRAAEIMFADRRFETPTGRVNLLCDADPTTPAATPDYPLLLMPISTDKAQSSQWLPGAQGGLAPVIVHPSSAPGFQDGDSAVLQSEIGEMQVVLRFDPRQRPGLAIAEKGGWLRKGRCANALIPAKESDAGGCAAYYETPVRLRRAAAQPIEANFSTSTT
jgi:anaerobic selenocysteine-containing dehydrogenase